MYPVVCIYVLIPSFSFIPKIAQRLPTILERTVQSLREQPTAQIHVDPRIPQCRSPLRAASRNAPLDRRNVRVSEARAQDARVPQTGRVTGPAQEDPYRIRQVHGLPEGVSKRGAGTGVAGVESDYGIVWGGALAAFGR